MSNIRKMVLLCMISFQLTGTAQEFSVPVHNPVYSYLFSGMLKGFLPEYDHYKIPLTFSRINTLLDSLYYREIRTTGNENTSTVEYIRYMRSNNGKTLSLFTEPEEASHFIFSDSAGMLYSYQDSLVRFSFDIVGDFSYNYGENQNQFSGNSFLMSYGAKAQLQAGEKLAFSLAALNGNTYGNREIAAMDTRVKNSFTFNSTGINNFDHTSGYIRYSGTYGTIFAGKEKLLVGASPVSKSILGKEKPDFPMISYEFQYKAASILFFHGWLANPLTTIKFDTTTVEKIKPAKYMSYARFGFSVNPSLRIGLSQIIIYAYRQPELAYMIPFLFWESSQRSMNDPDNGYLLFDFFYRPMNGVGISGEILVDDLNFDAYGTEGFNSIQNQTMFRMSLTFADFLNLQNTILGLEATVIRPYTFSHPGYKDALNFTNNGVPLGDNLNPNSIAYALLFEWFPNYNFQSDFRLMYSARGRNHIDGYGNLHRNVGGDIHTSYNYFTPKSQELLGGERENSISAEVSLKYRLSYRLQFEYFGRVTNREYKGLNKNEFFTGFSLNYSPFGEKF